MTSLVTWSLRLTNQIPLFVPRLINGGITIRFSIDKICAKSCLSILIPECYGNNNLSLNYCTIEKDGSYLLSLMNIKTIKLLIGFFLGLICLFTGLIALNYFDSKPAAPAFSASADAQRILAEAAAGANTREKSPPIYRTDLSTDSVRSQGAIMLVKNGEFGGVAEEPENMMDKLTELSGSNKKKNPPIPFTEQDLDKTVVISRSNEPEPPLNSSAVPGMDAGTATLRMGAKTMISAPVDYQLFTSSETWRAFAISHKGYFPAADFSKERMLILVSVSDMPSGIFKITGLKKAPRETLVLYRVDPLAMSAENAAGEYEFYSAAPVPKGTDIKLQQVP